MPRQSELAGVDHEGMVRLAASVPPRIFGRRLAYAKTPTPVAGGPDGSNAGGCGFDARSWRRATLIMQHV